MEMKVLDTPSKLWQHGHGMFGWCSDCGSPSRYWDDVRAKRPPKRAMFDVDLGALIRERGEDCLVVELEPVRCPSCGSANTETRVTAPAKPAHLRENLSAEWRPPMDARKYLRTFDSFGRRIAFAIRLRKTGHDGWAHRVTARAIEVDILRHRRRKKSR